MTPRIVVTPGEPAGIGPDLCLQLAQMQQTSAITLVADPAMIQQRASDLGLQVEIVEHQKQQLNTVSTPGQIAILPIRTKATVTPGELNPQNSAYVLECLNTACELIDNGYADALVTGPVHKGIINQSGFKFSGHTEFLAERTGADLPVMMLATEGLRVALVTTHLPLKDIAARITRQRVEQILDILINDLHKWFGLQHPSIIVSGLNPHAGEDGHLGTEEIEHIIPAIHAMQKKWPDTHIQGPLPADTLFTPWHLKGVDAVLAMYHDQGLPVLKYKGFGNAINVTLGLPIIRTSVDHGTALSLAASGKADTNSLQLAIDTATEMVKHHAT